MLEMRSVNIKLKLFTSLLGISCLQDKDIFPPSFSDLHAVCIHGQGGVSRYILGGLSIAYSQLGKDEGEVANLTADLLGSAERLSKVGTLGMKDKLKPRCSLISKSLFRNKVDNQPYLFDPFVCFSLLL